MDTITHGLIGTLGSKTGYYQKFGRIATYSFLLGSVFPDIDVIVSLLGPDFTMRHHRGLTHSVIAAPVFAMFITFITGFIFKCREYKKIYPMVLIGICSHIFFDLITAYGTVIFDPVSTRRYNLNLVFILDPFITIPVLIGLIISVKRRQLAFRVSSLLFAYLVIYLIFSFVVKYQYTNHLIELADSRNIRVGKIDVYPKPLAPFRWLGVIEAKDNFYKVNIDAFSSDPVVFERHDKSDSNFYVNEAKSHRVARLYHWFADFPVARYKKLKNGHIVEFHDLRFRMLSKRTPFTLRYVFTEANKIKEITLGGRRINNL